MQAGSYFSETSSQSFVLALGARFILIPSGFSLDSPPEPLPILLKLEKK
jgi:hypothetical protein